MADEIPDPFVKPIIEHGVKVSGLEDEDGALILSYDQNPMRDKVEQKGDSRAVEYQRWEDPRIEGEFSLRPRRNAIGENFGLGDIHPGTAVTDLVNLPKDGKTHGFRITDTASIIMGNPKDTRGDEGRSITQPFEYRPFVKSAKALKAALAA